VTVVYVGGIAVLCLLTIASLVVCLRTQALTRRTLSRATADARSSLEETRRVVQDIGRELSGLHHRADRQDEVSRNMVSQVRKGFEEIHVALDSLRLAALRTAAPTDEPDALPAELSEPNIMAEVSHVLRTPLNAIKLTVDLIEASVPRSLRDGDVQARLRDVKDAAETCVTSLAIFHELVGSARTTGTRGLDLRTGVETLFRTAALVVDRGTRLEAELPTSVKGFSNAYLLVLLQPLVENAVEHSETGSTVTVRCDDRDDFLMIFVENTTVGRVDGVAFESPGATTKVGGGLGTGIARRLARFRRGTITYAVEDLRVRAAVRLPRR
jgi:signal transduction histidine kinase